MNYVIIQRRLLTHNIMKPDEQPEFWYPWMSRSTQVESKTSPELKHVRKVAGK